MKFQKLLFLFIFISLCKLAQAEDIYNLTASSGTISVLNDDYKSDLYKVWNINTNTNRPVVVNYTLHLDRNYTDEVFIYAIKDTGEEVQIGHLMSNNTGTISSTFPSGRAKVVFRTYSGTGGYTPFPYSGMQISYSLDNSTAITSKMYISGKLGIGTIAPEAQLHVFGKTLVEGSLHVNGDIKMGTVSIAKGSSSTFGLTRFSYALGYYLEMGPKSTAAFGFYTDRSRFFFDKPVYSNTFSSNDDTNLSLCTNGTTRMTILNSNGNIGIGVANPVNKLEVDGVIRAKEVKIETGWADFVFNETYPLRPLAEVNDFIRKNKRLPDMPSGSQVEKDGVGLGEMQVKLLQKIEELTLYTIRQQTQIEALQQEVKALKENGRQP